MLPIDEVRRRLEPMNIMYVSRKTGVHANAIYRLMRGDTAPRYATIERLSNWLEGIADADSQ